MDYFCNSTLWDSNLTWYTSSPDFTECFKNTILVWVPSALLLLLLPLEISSYFHSSVKNIPWSFLNIAKMVLLLILVTVSITYYFVSYTDRFEEFYMSAIIVKCISYVTVFIWNFCCRKFGIHSSGVLHGFWLLSTIAEAIVYYSYIKGEIEVDFKNHLNLVLRSAIFGATACIFILSFFADKKPHYRQEDENQNIINESPEMWASFTSKLFIHWLTGFLWKSTKRTLQYHEIYELNYEEKAWTSTAKLHKQFIKGKKSETGNSGDINVLRAAVNAFASHLILPIIFQMACLSFVILSPVMVWFLIDFMSNDEPTWKGWLYSTLFSFSLWILNVGLHIYKTECIKPAIGMKSSVVVTLYKKVMNLSNSAREQMEIGKILNTMSLDAEGLSTIFDSGDTIWIVPFVLLTQTYILWLNFGASAFLGLGIILLSGPLHFFLSNLKVKLQSDLMHIKDKRIKTMSEVLSGIKVIKMYGWESSFQKQILQYRQEEYAILKKMSYALSTGTILFLVLPTISQFSVIACYTIYENKPLTAYSAFSSFIVISILRWAIGLIPELTNSITTALVSARRINRMLNSQELENYVQKGKNNLNAINGLSVVNASFGWSKDVKILRNISIRIKSGSLVAVLGEVGSGKSSLIAAILGEMEKLQGEVIANGSTAYVPQQPWILNASLRENILFGRAFEAEKYRSVVEACALIPDIETLPALDNTEIGEKGINLSGGQKQRVSLARALYGDFGIYLLDDPLGAVDSHVAKHIFTNVIGPQGLLQNKTRVLVTHNKSFLNKMDEVYVMSNGSLVQEPNTPSLVVEEDESDCITLTNKYHILVNRINYESNNKVKESLLKSKEDDKDHRLTKDEKISVNQTKSSVYWRYLKSLGLFRSGVFFILLAAQQVLIIGSLYWVALWVDDVAAGVETFSTHQRLMVYAAFISSQVVLLCVGCVLLQWACVKASQKLHSDMLSSVLSSPMSFFDVTPSGRILNRFTMDINETDFILPDAMLKLVTSIFMMLSNIIAVCVRVPLYIILVLLAFSSAIILQRIFSKSSQQLKRIESATKSPLYSHFSESVAGAHIIRVQGEFERFQRKVVDLMDKSNAVFNVKNLAVCWMKIRRVSLGVVFLLGVCVILVVLKGEIGSGMAGYIIANAYWLNAFLVLLVINGTSFESSVVCVERITEFTHLESEGNVGRHKKVPFSWPSEGKITFQRYFTRYRQGLDFVLKDLTFEIHEKEKVGVVGRTGSGKSTLTLALFRIIEATSGHIFIDDQNIAEIDLSVLRSRLTIIPQDPVLFSGTLRMNLDPFDQHQDDELWSALDHVQFARSLNDGLQHKISEGGQNLSVGQRQLVCLARALLRKSKILVLDEATASVDYETDELIQNTIRKEFWDCTIITIAHRLNTIMDYDRVMVLDHGTLLEYDRPLSLLKDETSLFYGLARDAGIVSLKAI